MVEQYRGMLAMLPNEVRFTRVSLGPFRLIFNPFELFSGYMQNLDPKKDVLVCYSQGYLGYLSCPDNQEISYETMIEILSNDDKKRLPSSFAAVRRKRIITQSGSDKRFRIFLYRVADQLSKLYKQIDIR